MRATRTLALVYGVVSSLVSACGQGASGDAATSDEPVARAVAAGAVGIWDDGLVSGWADWSWGSTRATTTSPVAAGTSALAVTFQAWGGLNLHRTAGAVSGMATLELYANGGSSAGNRLVVWAVQGSTTLPSVALAQYCSGSTIPANAWTRCRVPLTALAPAGAIDGIAIQEVDGAARPTMYFDAVSLLPADPPPAGSAIYSDALASGWSDQSWGSTRDFAATSPVASGGSSLAATFQAWGGLSFHRTAGSVTGMESLELSVNGGANTVSHMKVWLVSGNTSLPSVELPGYCAGGSIPANAWTHCKIPLSALGPAGTAIDGVVLQETDGASRPTMYFDDLALTGAASSTPLPPAVPAAPTNLAVTVSSGAVSLSWSAVSGATGYLVSRATASGGPFAALSASPQAGTTYRDTTVAAGTTYWYRVAAANAAGTGPASAAVSAGVPAAVVTVSVSPANTTLDACTAAQFSATVSGATDTSVTWSVQEGAAGGSIDSAGKYTAPSAAGTYHVVAVSKASSTDSAAVPVVVRDHILSVTVTPVTPSMAAGGNQQFAAVVTTSCGSFTAAAQ